jgi:hypothetical protein
VDDVFIGRMRLSKDWIRGGNDFLTLFKERIMTMTYRRLMIAGLTAAASLTTGLAHAGGATLTLVRSSLNNVVDSNSSDLWQYEGGTVQNASGTVIGTYIANRRVTNSATSTYNAAAETATLFFTPSVSSNPPNTVTLEGAWSYSSGEFIGSVAAASNRYHWLIGADAASSYPVSGGQQLVLTWLGTGMGGL